MQMSSTLLRFHVKRGTRSLRIHYLECFFAKWNCMQIVPVLQISTGGKNKLTLIYKQSTFSLHGAYNLKWPVTYSVHYSTVAV